jgi:hypothetical protein
MKPSAEPAAAPDGTGEERRRALGSFIWRDRAHVLAAASRCGDDGRNTIECELRGGSMTGAIPARSRIRIAFTRGPYAPGEIIAFMIGARIVVHRVVYLRRRGRPHELLITRGDAMILPDPPLDAGAVLGRVVEVASDGCWRPPGPRLRPPRRDRLLAFLVLAASAVMLEVAPGLARRFVSLLEATDRRYAWTRTLLY